MALAAMALLVVSAAAQTPAGLSGTAGGQTLDRVVAAVGNTAITASDVESEYRLELLLDGKEPDPDPGAGVLNQVRQRMIDRILLEDEVQADSIKVSPDDPAVAARWNALQKKFPNMEAFATALKQAGMSEESLKSVLAEQESILRVIDQRLRPEAVVEPPEIEAYYHDIFVPRLAKQGNQPAPPLSEVESRIREILVQQKIDGLLDAWLKRLRARDDVRVFGSAEAGGVP
ncbi:MAG TPA: SurA N-terminal domain-containing protein [Terriglobia bacterium]|nr:SurA N-terminal domain-containing protein [Terriglobia bacterium]